MKKQIQTVNPQTGRLEPAMQLDQPYKSGYGSDAETVARVEFADGTVIEQPTWAIEQAQRPL